ncbi:MAG: hypothetical protein LBQ50_10315 [Planctomycetaceae bacterium]|jgi:hypothetical protein|nr:hypothetical protein [Planctomycetaceae bacterium]
MKAILHIGTPKTGTTTIQETLGANREELQKQGFHFAHGIFSMTDVNGEKRLLGIDNNHIFLLYLCLVPNQQDKYIRVWMNQRQSDDELVIQEFIKEQFNQSLSSLTSNIHTVIFSAEMLASYCDVKNIKQLLEPFFDSFSIIVYLRKQEDAISSSLNTLLRIGADLPPITSAEDYEQEWYDYDNILSTWNEFFHKDCFSVRLFEKKSLVRNDLIEDFADCVGFSLDGMKRIEDQNVSINAKAANFLFRFNKYVPFTSEIRGSIVSLLEKHYKGKDYVFSQKQVKFVREKFYESNNKVAQKFLGRETLFEETDLSKYPENAPAEVTVDEALEISVFLLKEQFEEKNNLLQSQHNHFTSQIAEKDKVLCHLRQDLVNTQKDLVTALSKNFKQKFPCFSIFQKTSKIKFFY